MVNEKKLDTKLKIIESILDFKLSKIVLQICTKNSSLDVGLFSLSNGLNIQTRVRSSKKYLEH